MKHLFLSFSLLFFFSILAISQRTINDDLQEVKQKIVPFKSSPFYINHSRNSIEIHESLKDYSLLNLDRRFFEELSSKRIPYLLLTLPQSGRNDITLELVESDLLDEEFSVVLAPEMKRIQHRPIKHYKGIIQGQDKSFAAISILENEIMGIISHPSASGSLVLGKLEGSDSHVLYQDHQIANSNPISCHTEDNPSMRYRQEQLRYKKSSLRNEEKCVGLFLEVDFDIFQSRQNSVDNTLDYITALMNQVILLYQNEQISAKISEIVVWTQPSPYNATTSLDMLNAFRQNRPDFNGDVAQLLSYKSSGGIAYVNTLCADNKSFRTSFSRIQDNFQNIPTYSWSVHVIAHEFGHILGSQHTHACVWNGNNTAIDGCFTTDGSCSNPGIPQEGGTIMSYCHATSKGINFSNGFGDQPGNVLRSNVSQASCLKSCAQIGQDGNHCDDISFKVQIKTDAYPSENQWTITNSENKIVLSGGPYSSRHTVFTIDGCLPEGCYSFNIVDDYGDGMCCSYGEGYYQLIIEDQVEFEGGQFKDKESQGFCLKPQTPTCEDGIQNGDEEGIDCGGSCAPCPTCEDGIQNGNETDVDCGGDCVACQPDEEGTVLDTLAGHYFENGWELWTRGGVHASRVKSIHSPEGNFSIRLRNGQGEKSSAFSPTYDFTDYESITMVFQYKSVGMESGKGFNIQILKDGKWEVIKNFVSGIDFLNTEIKVDTLRNLKDFNSLSQIRFENLGSDNTDGVYIDAVEIFGYKKSKEDQPSCTDGIQNGNETGIDCGGDCSACQNEDDGNTSGDEDNEVQVVASEIAGFYFESDIEGWIRGGVNSSRVYSIHSAEGQYSVRLRNGQGISSSITSPLVQLPNLDSLKIEFSLKAVSFESGKSLTISYFEGHNWHNLDTLTSGVDFTNNQTSEFSLVINQSLASDFQLRFTAQGSDNSDLIYVDAIRWIGYQLGHVQPLVLPSASQLLEDRHINTPQLVPNPADTFVEIQLDEVPSRVQIVHVSGQVLLEEYNNSFLDVSTLNPGVYVAVINTSSDIYRLKFIKR